MDKNNVVSAEIVRQITRMVVEELQKQQRLERSTPIGVSNRHVHLDRADMDALFGPGSELTVKKMLGQPGGAGVHPAAALFPAVRVRLVLLTPEPDVVQENGFLHAIPGGSFGIKGITHM